MTRERTEPVVQRIREQLILPTEKPITRMDITPIIERDPEAFRFIIDSMANPYRKAAPDAIVSIESFGHLFASPLAYKLGSRLIVARQEGKLPRRVLQQAYDMVYAKGKSMEIHCDAITPGMTVAIVDDVVATGGSVGAAIQLTVEGGAHVVGVSCFVEVENLGARDALMGKGYRLDSVLRVRYDFLDNK